MPSFVWFGHYEREETPFASGGFAHIYRARKAQAAEQNNKFAIKILKILQNNGDRQRFDSRRRFLREINILKSLRSTGIGVVPRIHAFGIAHTTSKCHLELVLPHEASADESTFVDAATALIKQGDNEGWQIYAVMELIEDAITLEQIGRQGARFGTWKHTAALFCRVCEAVAVLHEKKIVHRDLNPANILVKPESDTIIIVDFGLAKDLGDNQVEEPPLTVNNSAVVCFPGYGVPESLLQATQRYDQYVLGTLAYHIIASLNRDCQFKSVQTLAKSNPIVKPDDILHELNPATQPSISWDNHPGNPWDSFFRTTMASEPTQRWPSVHELKEEFETIANKHPLRVLRTGEHGDPPPPVGRNGEEPVGNPVPSPVPSQPAPGGTALTVSGATLTPVADKPSGVIAPEPPPKVTPPVVTPGDKLSQTPPIEAPPTPPEPSTSTSETPATAPRSVPIWVASAASAIGGAAIALLIISFLRPGERSTPTPPAAATAGAVPTATATAGAVPTATATADAVPTATATADAAPPAKPPPVPTATATASPTTTKSSPNIFKD